ncbi:biotin/lipoyl-containing protein, partial [Pollutimonas bauzanensis]|uniref:biotin/lipoyl-containing protein n=1 Tax=Pollutimonas bauzanensis TaxID=658167 RepID=UPI0033416CBD
MSNTTEIKVPDIGDVSEVDVIEILVAVGDTVKKEQSLITVESDKASMEIPASQDGVVKSIKVKTGDKVKEGSVILELEAKGAKDTAKADQPAAAASPEKTAPKQSEPEASQAKAAAPAASETKGGPATVVVPDIGDTNEVDVIEIMVAVGDTITVDQGLITVESDKASMEVPSSHAGVITAIKVKIGDKVSQGSDILELQTTGAAAPVADNAASTQASAPAAAAAPSAEASQAVAEP